MYLWHTGHRKVPLLYANYKEKLFIYIMKNIRDFYELDTVSARFHTQPNNKTNRGIQYCLFTNTKVLWKHRH